MTSFKAQFTTGYTDKNGDPAISPSQVSLIVSMLSAGTVLGSLISAPMGDFFGRRRSLISAIGIFCFGVIFQVCASDIPLLLVGRCVSLGSRRNCRSLDCSLLRVFVFFPLSCFWPSGALLANARDELGSLPVLGSESSQCWCRCINQKCLRNGSEERWSARISYRSRWDYSPPP